MTLSFSCHLTPKSGISLYHLPFRKKINGRKPEFFLNKTQGTYTDRKYDPFGDEDYKSFYLSH